MIVFCLVAVINVWLEVVNTNHHRPVWAHASLGTWNDNKLIDLATYLIWRWNIDLNFSFITQIHGDHLFIGCGDGQLYIYSTQVCTCTVRT